LHGAHGTNVLARGGGKPWHDLAVMRWLGCLVSLAIACGSGHGTSADAPSVVDGAPPVDVPIDVAIDGGLTWDTVDPISNDGQVIVERVSYHTGALRIYARICRPADSAPHPVIVYNHGGWFGLDFDPLVAQCSASAKLGYVWLGSSYRGEDGSDGAIELCLGEVDDVLRALAIADAQPYTDPARVAMVGGSHGGCITLRALERGAPVRVAIDMFGPTDLAALDRFWRTNPSMYSQYLSTLETAAGGTADAVPAAYQARSPLYFLGDLPANVPLYVVHGTADAIVPYAQSCALAAAPLALAAYHLDASDATIGAPAGCTDPSITWQTGALPTSWPGSRYFVAYDGLGHETSSAAAMVMLQHVGSFLLAKL
jgi:dienelactone hydrolase